MVINGQTALPFARAFAGSDGIVGLPLDARPSRHHRRPSFRGRLYHFRLPFSGSPASNMLTSRSAVPAINTEKSACRPPSGSLDAEAGSDQALRGALRPLQQDVDPQQSGPLPRERIDRKFPRSSQDQASRRLLSRASKDFAARCPLVDEVVGRGNACNATEHRPGADGAQAAVRRERPLITNRSGVHVTRSRAVVLCKVLDSVPARPIGHRLRVQHLHDDRLECFSGSAPILNLRRARPGPSGNHGQVVYYQQIIHSLRRKPMALLNLAYGTGSSRDQRLTRRCRLPTNPAIVASSHARPSRARPRTRSGAELASTLQPDLDGGVPPELVDATCSSPIRRAPDSKKPSLLVVRRSPPIEPGRATRI